MSADRWAKLDELALIAFRLSGRLEHLADEIWPPGGERRVKNQGDSLAALAPDLLEKLKEAAFVIKAMRVQMHSWEIEPAFNVKAIEARIRTAIAKAEGAPS